MPRSLSTAVLAAIASKVVPVALFVELAFADNTIYVFSGVGKLTPPGPPANPLSTFPYGQTFTGLGWLAKLSAIPQTTKVQAQNVTLSLSGIPANLVLEAIGQVRIAGTATVWLAFFDSSGNLLQDPVQLFSGSMDVPSLSDSGDTSTIEISCENSLLSLNLAPNRQFDDADQQIYFPGDLGFSFVDKLEDLQLFWPAPVITGSPYPVFMTVTPSAVDIAVGGTLTVTVTIHYSDGSTHTQPGNTGSGPTFIAVWASSNPEVAEVSLTPTNNVTGISPGECSIIFRVPFGPGGGSGFSQVFRAACNIIVHS
jgi:Bacterial Ig-like domain (group 2)